MPSNLSHPRGINNHIIPNLHNNKAHHTNTQCNSLHTTHHHNISNHTLCNTRVDIKEGKDVDAAVAEAMVEDADAAIIKGSKIGKLARIIIKGEDSSKPGTKHHQAINNVKVFTANR